MDLNNEIYVMSSCIIHVVSWLVPLCNSAGTPVGLEHPSYSAGEGSGIGFYIRLVGRIHLRTHDQAIAHHGDQYWTN